MIPRLQSLVSYFLPTLFLLCLMFLYIYHNGTYNLKARFNDKYLIPDPGAEGGFTQLGEGPHFNFDARTLYFCDLWGRRAIRIDNQGQIDSVPVRGGTTGF